MDPVVEAFERGEVRSPFDHREHLRVAWGYLRAMRLEEALARFTAALQRVAAAKGVPGKYHATMTWGFLLALHEAMEETGPADDLEALLRARPDLLDHRTGVLLGHWTPEELGSPRARARFVLPRRARA